MILFPSLRPIELENAVRVVSLTRGEGVVDCRIKNAVPYLRLVKPAE